MIFSKKNETVKDVKKSKHKNAPKKVLIMCHSGMGSSMILKIKVTEMAKEEGYALDIHYAAFSENAVPADTDIIVTMRDLVEKFKGTSAYIISVTDIMDKEALKAAFEEYYAQCE